MGLLFLENPLMGKGGGTSKTIITPAIKHINCHAGLDKPAPHLMRGHPALSWIPAFSGMTLLLPM